MEDATKQDESLSLRSQFGSKFRLKSFLNNGDTGPDGQNEQNNMAPIADLFPHCTVFFADIAGYETVVVFRGDECQFRF